MSHVIIDGIVAAVLIGFFIYGAMRGLFHSIAGLLVMVLALAGACIFANEMTPVLSQRLQPWIEKRVEERVDSALSGRQEELPTDGSSVQMPEIPVSGASSEPDTAEEGLLEKLNLQQLLKLLGIDQDPAASLEETVHQRVRDTGVSVVTAMISAAAESLLHTVLFAVSLGVLGIVLHLIARALGLVMRLPGLHLANQLAGGAVGLLEGALALFLAVWILRRLGVSFDTELVEGTRLLRFFTVNTPLSVLPF